MAIGFAVADSDVLTWTLEIMNILLQHRSAGLLCPVFSLPSPRETGRWRGFLGDHSLGIIDWMGHCGFAWWQILPLNPVDASLSPYSSPSSFALDPRLIDPRLSGLPDAPPGNAPGHVKDDPDVLLEKLKQPGHEGLMQGFRQFCLEHHAWLDDHALFHVLKSLHGQRPWTQWPTALRDRSSVALRDFSAAHLLALQALKFEQFIAWSQWQRVRLYARHRGIRVIGDLPIHVAWDSVDVWAHRELFQLEEQGLPARITGVPPDAFAASGQCWGTPAPAWEHHSAGHFAWWRRRLRHALTLADAVRIDHFNGLVRGWTIPADRPDARHGRWETAPGEDLLSCWQQDHGNLPLIAEDLGAENAPAQQLRRRFGIPGMKVLQFAFDGSPDNPHLPHYHDHCCVAYTGTHDNDTTLGWHTQLDERQQRRVGDFLGGTLEPMPLPLVRLALGSVAPLAIVPISDWLALGSEARLNSPGALHGQWRWQLDMQQLNADSVLQTRHLLHLYGRRHVGGPAA
jgi:4-alpha-glucanotransferase